MLRILNLKLENFMNIEKADLNFDSSLIMIYGEPASGKSSIFEAIAVCLSSMKRSGTYGEYVKQEDCIYHWGRMRTQRSKILKKCFFLFRYNTTYLFCLND